MFFKRLSRSRSNSQSYVDQSPHEGRRSYADEARYASAPDGQAHDSLATDDRRELPSSRQSNTAFNEGLSEKEMYPRQSQPQEVYASPPLSATGGGPVTNGYGSRGAGGYVDDVPPQKMASSQAPPDLLMQAFNQALRPHMDKVDGLENEIADLRAYIDQLEQQRSDVHAWIDKRGLRPGMRKLDNNTPLDRASLTISLRRTSVHRTANGLFLPQLLFHPRSTDTKRATRPQNHNRQLRPPPPAGRPQRLTPYAFIFRLHAQIPTGHQPPQLSAFRPTIRIRPPAQARRQPELARGTRER